MLLATSSSETLLNPFLQGEHDANTFHSVERPSFRLSLRNGFFLTFAIIGLQVAVDKVDYDSASKWSCIEELALTLVLLLSAGRANRSSLLVKIKAFLAWSVLTGNSAHSFLEIPCPTS